MSRYEIILSRLGRRREICPTFFIFLLLFIANDYTARPCIIVIINHRYPYRKGPIPRQSPTTSRWCAYTRKTWNPTGILKARFRSCTRPRPGAVAIVAAPTAEPSTCCWNSASTSYPLWKKKNYYNNALTISRSFRFWAIFKPYLWLLEMLEFYF